MKWFGEPWPSATDRAPICAQDIHRVPVPVGAICAQCDESFVASSRGVKIPHVVSTDAWKTSETILEPWHLECLLYTVLGPESESPSYHE